MYPSPAMMARKFYTVIPSQRLDFNVNVISFPESSFPLTSGRKRELWEQPFWITKEITEFHCAVCIYGACLKWLLPELSFSDRWSRDVNVETTAKLFSVTRKRILGEPGPVNRGARKINGHDEKFHESLQGGVKEPLGTDSHQTISITTPRMLAPDWAEKSFVLFCSIAEKQLLRYFGVFLHGHCCMILFWIVLARKIFILIL